MGVTLGLDNVCFDLNAAVSANVIRQHFNLILMAMLTCCVIVKKIIPSSIIKLYDTH